MSMVKNEDFKIVKGEDDKLKFTILQRRRLFLLSMWNLYTP